MGVAVTVPDQWAVWPWAGMSQRSENDHDWRPFVVSSRTVGLM
jgi:hypothetical protein